MEVQIPSDLPDYLSADQRQRLRWVDRQLRIEVVSACWWQLRTGWEMKPRRTPDDFFFIPMSHRLEVEVDRQRATIVAGQCMFARAGQWHRASLPASCPEMNLVAIHANLLPQWGGALEQLIASPFQTLPDLSASEKRLARVTHLLQTDPPLGRSMGEQMLHDWLAFWCLDETGPSEARVRADPRVAQAVAVIYEHFDQPLTVEQLAWEVHLRPVQFRKLFRRTYGQSPKAYLAEYRLKQAAQQLRVGIASVKEIAHATGFTDPHYFHLAFRRRFGCTPLVYRRRNHQAV